MLSFKPHKNYVVILNLLRRQICRGANLLPCVPELLSGYIGTHLTQGPDLGLCVGGQATAGQAHRALPTCGPHDAPGETLGGLFSLAGMLRLGVGCVGILLGHSGPQWSQRSSWYKIPEGYDSPDRTSLFSVPCSWNGPSVAGAMGYSALGEVACGFLTNETGTIPASFMVLGWGQMTGPPRRWGFSLGYLLISSPPPTCVSACDVQRSRLRMGSGPLSYLTRCLISFRPKLCAGFRGQSDPGSPGSGGGGLGVFDRPALLCHRRCRRSEGLQWAFPAGGKRRPLTQSQRSA